MLHEYGGGCSPRAIRHALKTPLIQAFALFAAVSARYGNEPKGPTYAERDLAALLSNPASATE